MCLFTNLAATPAMFDGGFRTSPNFSSSCTSGQPALYSFRKITHDCFAVLCRRYEPVRWLPGLPELLMENVLDIRLLNGQLRASQAKKHCLHTFCKAMTSVRFASVTV